MKNKDNIEEEFKKIIEYKTKLSPEEFNKKYKNQLVPLDEFKDLKFSGGLGMLDIDEIFDPKIREKVIKLKKQDDLKRAKFKEKEGAKRLKALKQWKKENKDIIL